MRNIPHATFRILHVRDFPHSAIRILPVTPPHCVEYMAPNKRELPCQRLLQTLDYMLRAARVNVRPT